MNTRKCTIKAKDHRDPVEGSVHEEKRTGTCPECLTEGVKLSKGGHVGAHSISVDVDPTLPVVATGSPKGDPRDATVRRAVEARRIAADAAPMPLAPSAPEGRDERKSRAAMSPGPVLVRGRSTIPMASEVARRKVGDPRPEPMPLEDSRTGWNRMGGTMYGATGRERMDKESSTVKIIGDRDGWLTQAQYDRLTRTQQRKYWSKVKRAKDARTASRGTSLPQRPAGSDSKYFADGSSAETERLMQQQRS